MGCATCKGKNKKNLDGKNNKNNKNDESDENYINLIPKAVQNGDWSGNFGFKLLGLFALVVCWPFITIGIFYMVFVNFFIPKKSITNIFSGTIEWMVTKYATFKGKQMVRKREKEFKNNRDYNGESELLDIEVFTNNKDNNDEDSE